MKSDLFDLIKKLSEAERKAVSAEAFIYKKDGSNILYKLFTLIDKQDKPNDEDLKKKIPNLSNRKKELWYKIMQVLQMHETNIIMVNERRKLDFAHILIKKGLFKQAAALAQNVKEISIKYENSYLTGMAIQYQTMIVEQSHNATRSSRSYELSKELVDNAETIGVLAKAYDFYVRVSQADSNSNFLRDPSRQQEAQKFISDEYINLPINKMGIMAACMFTDAKSSVHYVLRDFDKSIEIENEMQMFFANRDIKTPPVSIAYRNYLINRMNLLDHVRDLKTWQSSLKKYKEHIDTCFANDLMSTISYYTSLLWYHYRLNKCKSAATLIKEAELFYNQYHTVELEQFFLNLQWDFIIIFFELEQFEKAWYHCHSFLENPLANVKGDVKEFMRLFFLFIILEKKEWDVLKVKIKYLEKILRTKDTSLYAFDTLVVAFMKKMYASRGSRTEQKHHWLFLLNEITSLKMSSNLYTLEVLDSFNFVEWIESKKT